MKRSFLNALTVVLSIGMAFLTTGAIAQQSPVPQAAVPTTQAPAEGAIGRPPGNPMPRATAAQMAAENERAAEMLSDEEKRFGETEARLQRDIRLAQLRGALLDAQKELASTQKEMDAITAPPAKDKQEFGIEFPDSTTSRGPVTEGSVIDVASAPPFMLVSVWGESGNLKADLFQKGLRVTVGEGDVLSSGWRVTKIDPNSMSVAKGKERMTVQIGAGR